MATLGGCSALADTRPVESMIRRGVEKVAPASSLVAAYTSMTSLTVAVHATTTLFPDTASEGIRFNAPATARSMTA
jgi:hypothetical protein